MTCRFIESHTRPSSIHKDDNSKIQAAYDAWIEAAETAVIGCEKL
jgi:hypothetical protein